jgi:membrane-bound metal-dependent hydrolase YbcI (DUF457 family)
MASPVAHVLVGLGCAAVVAKATGMPASPELWLGAIVSSCLPDFDFLGVVFRRSARCFHRHATHSLLVLLGFILVAMLTLKSLPGGIDADLGLAWSAALLSHPLVDTVTTGPALAARGAGIPLFWPILSRRWFLRRPFFPTIDLMACRSLREVWKGVLRENYYLAPATFILVLSCYLF